ncbi:uncharacterized protein LOC123668070 [Melitaea cinxia]|uniref:uncharacterized protein LOC123668070 n=1 Tax=Melitaea cinxia TaxID=113334 RepID=UPI001E273233|nr:uncharacterized protein LOC123668070 [Melitaea cinxia]
MLFKAQLIILLIGLQSSFSHVLKLEEKDRTDISDNISDNHDISNEISDEYFSGESSNDEDIDKNGSDENNVVTNYEIQRKTDIKNFLSNPIRSKRFISTHKSKQQKTLSRNKDDQNQQLEDNKEKIKEEKYRREISKTNGNRGKSAVPRFITSGITKIQAINYNAFNHDNGSTDYYQFTYSNLDTFHDKRTYNHKSAYNFNTNYN